MSCRDEILKCAREVIDGKGQNEFTIGEILDCMRRHGSKYSESTIRTHIVSRLCANAPDHHAVTYSDLERTDRGTYRLRGRASPSSSPKNELNSVEGGETSMSRTENVAGNQAPTVPKREEPRVFRSKRNLDLNRTVTKEEFDETIGYFEHLEPARWHLYRMGLNLLAGGLEVEAYLLILATWNFARFRYVMRTFNLDRFREAIEATRPHFERLNGTEFENANFDTIAADVTEVYVRFKGLADQTGASKILHFKQPRLFVIWDTEIRKRYGIPNEGSAEDFLRFQKLMQSRFAHLSWVHSDKSLPKAIDEFNFVWVHRK